MAEERIIFKKYSFSATPKDHISMFLKIGHRGACGYEPENTLRSFSKALELGVDMIELDIQTCKTGELVAIHDAKVDRTTNGKGRIANLTFEEIRSLDAGKNEQIPTLQEVFNLVNRNCKINVELKDTVSAQAVASLISEYLQKGWETDDFLISSFYHKELQKFSHLLPKMKIGALVGGLFVFNAKFVEDLHAYSANVDKDFIDQDFVNDAHSRDIKVLVYTVNDEDDIAEMKALGVDGIFSNYPDRL